MCKKTKAYLIIFKKILTPTYLCHYSQLYQVIQIILTTWNTSKMQLVFTLIGGTQQTNFIYIFWLKNQYKLQYEVIVQAYVRFSINKLFIWKKRFIQWYLGHIFSQQIKIRLFIILYDTYTQNPRKSSLDPNAKLYTFCYLPLFLLSEFCVHQAEIKQILIVLSSTKQGGHSHNFQIQGLFMGFSWLFPDLITT